MGADEFRKSFLEREGQALSLVTPHTRCESHLPRSSFEASRGNPDPRSRTGTEVPPAFQHAYVCCLNVLSIWVTL
jgi:hypothetical protein